MRELTSVCVFCGSKSGDDPAYRRAAADLGARLGEQSITVVYGASSMGVMGALADAALETDGRVVGVIPRHLTERELPKSDLTELHVVDSMHERKALMFDRADAFITLPGGLGTLDELFEVLTWSQLGLHAKAVGLLDVNDYFSDLVAFLDKTVDDGFVSPEHRELLVVDTETDKLIERLREVELPTTEGWFDKSGR